jgi:Ser/Thr protein kinase RdoA (MazF antagonist)
VTGIGDVPVALAAASAAARAVGLTVDEVVLVHASNRLAVRLIPAEVLARVAPGEHSAAQFEVDLAIQLATAGAPIGTLDPRVAPGVHERDGFAITLWTWYDAAPSNELSAARYADALQRLHVSLGAADLPTPHFTDRVDEALAIVEAGHRMPGISEPDRRLIRDTLEGTTRSIRERGATEQLLHGEPHPGNVLNTRDGPLFIDLETCCRGPIEFDLANAPHDVANHYPGVDRALLDVCRLLTLALIAAWRLDPGDQLPQGRQAARELLAVLRSGPPYPPLGVITGLQ